MSTPLRSPLAAGRGSFQTIVAAANRHRAAFLLGLGLLGAAPAAHAQQPTIYGLGTVTSSIPGYAIGTQGIVLINPATGEPLSPTGATITVQVPFPGIPGLFVPVIVQAPTPVTGVAAGQTLVGLDVRTSTGEFYALGYDASLSAGTANNAQLYVLNPTTGVATATGAAQHLDLGNTNRIGFDFNPTVDRIRVVSAATQANYRLNPTSGAFTKDTNLSYAATDLNKGATPGVGAIAYLNSFPGSTSTTLYDIDELSSNGVNQQNSGAFSIQTSPNTGVLNTIPTGPNITFNKATTSANIGNVKAVDLDLYYNPATSQNEGYLIEVTPPDVITGAVSTNFYTLSAADLATGKAIFVANTIPKEIPFEIRDIAAGVVPNNSLLTWNGSVSTVWETAQNWTPSVVPSATTDVIIPGAPANQPVVSNAQAARQVTLTTGGRLTTADGGTLSVAGDFINNGGSVSGAGSGAIALAGAASQTISGSSPTTFFNLRVGASGAALSTATAVQRLLTLSGGLSTNGQSFTLLSNAQGQGQVVNSGGTVSGRVSVQRAIEGSQNAEGIGYRHYSSPVQGAAVSDLNSGSGSGFSAVLTPSYNGSTTPRATVPFPNVYGYDQDLIAGSVATDHQFNFDKGFFVPTDGFAAGNPRAGLQPGHGYAVNIANDVTVDFVGPLNDGDLTVGGLTNSGAAQAGFQFLGNPYPSALDWNGVTRSANIEPSLYVFKSTGQYAGFYTSYNNGQSANSGTSVLPLGQGFFVHAASASTPASAVGSVTFRNAARLTTYDATPFQRGAADARPALTLALRTPAGRGEQAVIYFEAGATAGYDAAYDAFHLAGPGAPLGLAAAGNLSISGLPALTGADVLVPLELSAATAGTYTLRADALSNLPAGYHAYLRDALTGTLTDLLLAQPAGQPLALSANASATGRFAVLFSTQAQALATAPAALAQLAGVYPNPAHGTASLLLPAALRGGQATLVQVLNGLGQVVLTRTLAAGAPTLLELPLTGLAPGIYSVRAHTAAGQVVKRLTVE